MNVEIANSVAKNTAVQMGQQVITWASSFLLMLFLPRYLGPVGFGRIYLAMTISGIFLMIIDYDGRLGIAKRIARSRENSPRILANSIGFRILFWIVAFVGMMAFTFFAHYPTTIRWLVFLFGLEMLWCGGKTVLLGLFLGFESVQFSSIGAIAERAFISLVGVGALLLGANEIVIAIVMISGTLLNFSIMATLARRFVSFLPRIDWKESRALIKDGFPYLLWSIFGSVYYRIDTVMLSMFVSEAVVGWYGASYKFLDILSFIPSIFSISLLPILSRLQGNDTNTLQRTTQKSLEFIMIAVYPICISLYALSSNVISLFYGLSSYAPSVINLQLLSIGLPLIYIDMVLGTALLACDKQRQWAATAFFAAILNVTLNLFLIPYFQVHTANGGIGAALATIVTEFFVLVSALFLLPKNLLDATTVPVSLKAIAAGCVMAIATWFLWSTHVHWIIQITVGMATYAGTLLALKTFKSTEIAFMKNFLSLKNLKNTFAFTKGTSV